MWALIIRYSHAWSCIACHAPKFHKESKTLDSDISFSFFFFFVKLNSLTRVALTITNVLDLSIWRLRFKQLHVQVQQTQQSTRVFITTGFHFQRISLCGNIALAKFRGCEFSLWPNFAGANFRYGEISLERIFAIPKFRQNEISLQLMRNFAKITAKFRLTQRKFASALTKIRSEISPNFRENKERKTTNFVCISFAQYCTIDWSISPGSLCLPCLLGWNPSLSSFKSKFHLPLTEVSVQGASVSLACWVGIPVYLVLKVSFIYHWLKYQSREPLCPLLPGLESQFIYF